jgi:putative ATPase
METVAIVNSVMIDATTLIHQPLAERLRPQQLSDVVGQAHLMAFDKPLGMAYAAKRLHSMILWGSPGVGKTSLARLLAQSVDLPLIALSAVLAGVKDIRDAVEQAKHTQSMSGKSTVVFVDEVHRFNKSQQDAFLPHVETGLLIFIGATTENPSFEINAALLSRAAVYVLEPLTDEDLTVLLERGIAASGVPLSFDADALAMLVRSSDGDGRRLFNNLESVLNALHSLPEHDLNKISPHTTSIHIDIAFLTRTLSQALRRFDKSGEVFYDQMSALHKSVRGSHPDAALYWFARMVDGGVDLRYLARRLIRMASEDIGLADPRALQITLNAADAYERLGSPEGDLTLAQAVVYLAVAAKSNAVYTAYKQVLKTVQNQGSLPVPLHLRNAPTKLMKDLCYGRQYRYAHDEPNAYAAGANYLPDGLMGTWYQPVPRGLEIKIAEKLAQLKQWDHEAS